MVCICGEGHRHFIVEPGCKQGDHKEFNGIRHITRLLCSAYTRIRTWSILLRLGPTDRIVAGLIPNGVTAIFDWLNPAALCP